MPLAFLLASCGPPPDPNPPPAATGAPSATAAPAATTTEAPAPRAPATGTIDIDSGTACAVTSGKVACWGDNTRLVIAAAPKGPIATPVQIPGIDDAIAVDVGHQFACALTSSGKIECFREGAARAVPLLDDVKAIAIRDAAILAVRKSGKVVGLDLGWELKDSRPVDLPELTDVIGIASSDSHSCALHKSGEITCWGDPELNGSGVDTSEMEWEERNKLAEKPVKLKEITDAVQISASDTHTCAVRKSGQIMCWGSNWSGELGDGTEERRPGPVAVQLVEDATAVTAGHHHTCARRSSGKVLCWGEGRAGQLGSGTPGARGMVEVKDLGTAAAVAAGDDVSCAMLADGSAQCWGAAARGRLGDGTTSEYALPQPVKAVSGAKQVIVGDRLSCMIDAKKQMSCWGQPGFADDSATRRLDPVPMTALGEVESVFARDSGMCVVNKGKTIFCDSFYAFLRKPRELAFGAMKQIWTTGSAGSAILPTGQALLWQRDWDKADAVLKQNVTGLSDMVSIAGEAGAMCGVRKSGKVACAGYGYRVFDKKNPIKPAKPVEVPGITDAVAIAGSGDICVLRKSGEVACFSSFRVPQPVDPKKPAPAKIDAPRPIEVQAVKGLTNVASLSMGGGTRCALLKDATVSCWGSNSYGQLGVGDLEHRWDPAPVPGLTDVASLAVGGNHVCAAKKSGEVLCWGRNVSDEAGQPAPAFVYAPVAVKLPK
ncbi:MAG: hypothetical protein R3B70_04155 [Polyangiaceae bacterium]